MASIVRPASVRVPGWAIAAFGLCLLYVVNPVDLLPDWVPVLGQIDDFIAITGCLMLIEQELQEYKHWKFNQLRAATASDD